MVEEVLIVGCSRLQSPHAANDPMLGAPFGLGQWGARAGRWPVLALSTPGGGWDPIRIRAWTGIILIYTHKKFVAWLALLGTLCVG